MERFSVHLIEYQSIFKNKTKVCFDKAELYTQGIIKSNMRNIERISEELGANYHQMQHFITESNWNGREVIDKVAKDVSTSLPKFKLTADGYYGNDASLARSINIMGLLYMLDIHADQAIYLEHPGLVLPERKSSKGPEPKKLIATTDNLSVSKYLKTLGLDQFQTRMWNAWVHQVALNFMVSSFMLKEKLFSFDDLPLLSARDIKEYLTFKLYKNMTEEQMIDRIYNRHLIRQIDINNSYLRV